MIQKIIEKMKFRTLLILVILNNLTSQAQIIKPDSTVKHIINFNTGYDYNILSINLGYDYFFSKLKTSAFINFTQGSSLLGTSNIRTEIGLKTWQGTFKKFNIRNSLAFVHTHSTNKAGNYDGLGLNLITNVGFTFNRFGIGLDLQYNPFFATHIKHSDYWKTYFYSDAKDGWYSLTSNNLRMGLYMSELLGKQKKTELNLKGGYQSSGQYDKLIPNIYFIIGLNKRF